MSASRAVLLRAATSSRLQQAVTSVPGAEARAWRAASRYVAGRDRSAALARSAELLRAGHRVSIDLFGEQVRDSAAADEVLADYLDLVTVLPKGPASGWLSVDLSHLGLGLHAGPGSHGSGGTDGIQAVAGRLAKLAAALPPGGRVQVGAEEAARADAVLACVLEVAGRGLADRIGATVQATLHRAPDDAVALAAAGVHVRLVKGAYLEASGAHPYGEATDVAFLRLAHLLHGAGAIWSMATHDARLREALLLALGTVPVEQLLGVRPGELDELRRREIPTRVYVPYGPNWFRYWLRRLAESRGG